ncbi:MAG: hypothetical protein A2Y63_00790 [Candidatus Riflebacteria bacterium RBG_13_59_9]|nr:MAG: hypothetical protein A2Y63_00790 [Candidatus Riflebacteria bacterium RBG_13_59_9]
MTFAELCDRLRPEIVSFLHKFTADHVADERLRAGCLHLLGRGKLVRPLALIVAARTFKPAITEREYLHVASALEFIHTFTLIHDDLPEMDNAKLRRGVAAVHVEFGSDLGLLVGDALFNLAFLALSEAPELGATTRQRILTEITGAVNAVIAGQAQELALSASNATLEDIEEVERLKTGSLFACALACGALLADADEQKMKDVREFALLVGHAFQVKDDLLSAVGDAQTVGKDLEQDATLQRPTIVRLLGVEAAQRRFEELNEKARHTLARLDTDVDTGMLQELQEALMRREK